MRLCRPSVTLYWPVLGLCWSIEEAMLPQLLLGLGLVGWGWSVVVCAGGFGVGWLGLVSGDLCLWVWTWWVGISRSWFVRGGLSWSYVGRSWSYVGPCWGYVSPSLSYGLVVSGGLCCRVCAWWVGMGCGRSVRLVSGRSVVVCALGLVGWGWSVVVCA